MISFFILAGIPAIYWIWLFYLGNRYRRSDIKIMILLFFGGVACAGFALTLNHIVEKYTLFWTEAPEMLTLFGTVGPIPIYQLGFWFMVGFNEEFAKLAAFLLIAFHRRSFNEPYDGLLYMAMVALGFATIENAIYLDRYGLSILLIRTLITLPIHVFISAPMGYFVAKARLGLNDSSGKSPVPLAVGTILTGWSISAMLHASYDAFLSVGLQNFAYALFFIMALSTLLLWRHSMRQSRLAPSSSAS